MKKVLRHKIIHIILWCIIHPLLAFILGIIVFLIPVFLVPRNFDGTLPDWAGSFYLVPFVVIWFWLTAKYVTERVEITENLISFKNLFMSKTIKWDSIVDWSVSRYRTHPYLPIYGKSIEIWYKTSQGKIEYHEKTLSDYSNAHLMVEVLKEKGKRTENMQKDTRSIRFYMSRNNIFVWFMGFVFITLLIASIIFYSTQPEKDIGRTFIVISLILTVVWGGHFILGIGRRSRT